MIVSTDGGDSFHPVTSPATGVTTLGSLGPHFPGETFRVLTVPTACVFGQTVVAAWADFREGVSRIYYALSTNGGASWTTGPSGQPLLTGALPANFHHFHPQMVADPKGVIGCAFYEFGPKPSTPLIGVIMAQSFDGGASFDHFTVTDQPWDPAVDAPWAHGNPNITFIGDYFGLDASVRGFYPLWTDTRTGIQELWTAIVPKKDCIIITDRNTFGKEEIDALLRVSAPAVVGAAFYVFVDGFRAQELNITAATLSGKPDVVPSMTLTPAVSGMTVGATACSAEDPTLPDIPQSFTWTYQVIFANDSGFTQEFEQITLTASITSTAGTTVTGQAVITLTKQPNPYEIDGPVSWLSTDLRVFQIQPGQSLPSTPTVLMGNDPNDFITRLIQNYNDPALPRVPNHPFDSDISTDEQASAVELAQLLNGVPVYNFAIARVRYRALL